MDNSNCGGAEVPKAANALAVVRVRKGRAVEKVTPQTLMRTATLTGPPRRIERPINEQKTS